MRHTSVDLGEDCHPDDDTSTGSSSNHALSQENTPQSGKMGAWGDTITAISNEDVCFLFQNVNGLSNLPGIHESLKSKMIELHGTVTALVETNVNW